MNTSHKILFIIKSRDSLLNIIKFSNRLSTHLVERSFGEMKHLKSLGIRNTLTFLTVLTFHFIDGIPKVRLICQLTA